MSTDVSMTYKYITLQNNTMIKRHITFVNTSKGSTKHKTVTGRSQAKVMIIMKVIFFLIFFEWWKLVIKKLIQIFFIINCEMI